MLPGPVSETRWWPSAPKYRLTMPGNRITENVTLSLNRPDVPGVDEQ